MRRSRWRRLAGALLLSLVCGSARAEGEPPTPRPIEPGTRPPAPRSVAPEEPLPSRRYVTQAEWAALLVEALGLADALPPEHDAEDLFSILCPDAQEQTVGAGGRAFAARPPFRVVAEAPRARAPGRPLQIAVQVPATAVYALSVQGRGRQTWWAGGRPVGRLDVEPLGAGVAPTLVPLARGPRRLVARLDPDARVDRVELVAHRALCVAPAGGWNARAALTFGAKARSLVRALGLEARLPAAGAPLRVEGEAFDAASTGAARTNAPVAALASDDAWAVARADGAELVYRLRLEEPGVYAIAARLHGRGRQLWSVDRRYLVSVRPGPASHAFDWTAVVTLPLESGEHVIRARLPRDAGVDVLRLSRRHARDADYLAVLEGVGFREGPPDLPVRRDDALRNLGNATSRRLAAGFLARLSGAPDDEIALVQVELDRLYSRPLSPLLPADL